jgi:hypothetical protein
MSNLYVKIMNFRKVFLHRYIHAHPHIFQEKQSLLGAPILKLHEQLENQHLIVIFNLYFKLEWSFSAVSYIPSVLVLYLYKDNCSWKTFFNSHIASVWLMWKCYYDVFMKFTY